MVCTQAGTTITPGVYRDLTVEFRGKCNFQGPGDFVEKEVCPGDTLTIFGEGFNADTVKTVYFFEAGATIADPGNPAASAACMQNTISFIDAQNMQIEVPTACAAGKDYHLGLIGDSLDVNLFNVLTIKPLSSCP